MYDSEPLGKLLDVKPPPFLIEELLRKNTITLLASEPYTGKTLIMLYWALCMESGKKVFDKYQIPVRTSSMFLALDSPRWDIALQLQKLSVGLNLTSADYAMMDSHILTRGKIPRPQLLDPKFGEWLCELRDEKEIDTIFIDTGRQIHSKNENSSDEMGTVMEKMQELVDKEQLTIIVAAHDGKPGLTPKSALYRVRGSTVIPGSVDYHYSLGLNKHDQIIFDGTAKRRGGGRRQGHLLLELKDLPNEGLGIAIVEEQQDAETQNVSEELVLGALASDTQLPAPQIVEKSGLSYNVVQKVLAKLLDEGKVERPARGVWKLASVSQ
jgi:hypothetical protein